MQTGFAQVSKNQPTFSVIAFYIAKNDQAHISFVHEANRWFAQQASQLNFKYDSTNDWQNLNDSFLKKYNVVIFLDTRPEDSIQRNSFEKYMMQGGAWMGFHFSAFALTPSDYPQNWNWYHQSFLGADQYKSNTWRPTSAILKVEAKTHPILQNVSSTFKAAPNEWYRWTGDLTTNPDIQILLSIDESSFPLGTGPKPEEIWHEGYYPVAWTNKRYKMVYFNMGHNDIDYEHHTNRRLSETFSSPAQNKVIMNALFWLAGVKQD
jgi:hypothetical protein